MSCLTFFNLLIIECTSIEIPIHSKLIMEVAEITEQNYVNFGFFTVIFIVIFQLWRLEMTYMSAISINQSSSAIINQPLMFLL